MEEIEVPKQSVEWLWYGVKDVDGVVGRHRVGIKYMDPGLEARRIKRLEREEEGRMDGQGDDTNEVGSESGR